MTCNIIHRTVYGYSAPVTVSQHAARVEPRSLRDQFLEEFSLRIEPEPSVRTTRTDYFGNRICFFSIQEVHSRLEIVAECRVTVVPVTQPVLSLSPRWEQVARLFSDPVSPEVVEP
jgi:transglutaminase-like putative cysteine protease